MGLRPRWTEPSEPISTNAAGDVLFLMKHLSPVVVVGTLLTLSCIALYILGPGFIKAISNRSYDEFIKSMAESSKSDSVVIVDIDEDSMSRFGQWPWPRYILADLTSKLFDAGAVVVGYDVVFPEPDRLSPSRIRQNIKSNFQVSVSFEGLPETLENYDLIFAEALEGRNAILSCMMHVADGPLEDINIYDYDPYFETLAMTKGKGTNLNAHLFQAKDLTISIPELNRVSRTAFVNAVAEEDGVIRRNPLVWSLGDNLYPSLALESVRLYLGEPRYMVRHDENGVKYIQMRELIIPTDGQSRLAINYRRLREKGSMHASCFPTFSVEDVFDGAFENNAFDGKIVLIGTSAAGLKDIRTTPLSQHFPGVEIHATMIDNILSGDMLDNPSWMVGANVIGIALMGMFLTVFINRGRSWLSFLVSVAMILLAVNVSMYLIDRKNVVFVPAWVILSIIIIYPVLTMIKYWQEELQKKRVRNMFGTMVSSDVLSYLENNPGSFSLSGHKVQATMFFSDVEGFTTISESLQPERLSELLNRYLSPMTQIIMNRRGYVDKYEGDLIMAEWGVPFAMSDHAVQGCLAALEQQAEIENLRSVLKNEFGFEIRVRMGINSGDVTAGNMGSDRRFQYTVMGDAVNQAARFEPANKVYGTSIIIGEETYRQASGAVEARLLDKAIVKGKTRPINIYELLCGKEKLPDVNRKVVDLYQRALSVHWERKWDEALELLKEALTLDPGDQPSARMMQRVEHYIESPPGKGWMGEYTASIY